MAVLANDTAVDIHGPYRKVAVPCAAADTFYAGAVAWYDRTSGSKLTVAPAAGDRVAGIVLKNTVTTAADQLVDILIDGVVAFGAIANIDAADIGDHLIFDVGTAITDNYTDAVSQTGVTLAANDAILGEIVSYLNSRSLVAIARGLTGLIYDATAAAFV